MGRYSVSDIFVEDCRMVEFFNLPGFGEHTLTGITLQCSTNRRPAIGRLTFKEKAECSQWKEFLVATEPQLDVLAHEVLHDEGKV